MSKSESSDLAPQLLIYCFRDCISKSMLKSSVELIGSYFLSFDYLVFLFPYNVKNDGVSKIGDYHWSWLKRQRVPNGRKRLFLDDFDHLLMMRVWKIDEGGSSASDLFLFFSPASPLLSLFHEHFAKNSFPKSIFSWGFPNTYTTSDFSLPSVWQMICLFYF